MTAPPTPPRCEPPPELRDVDGWHWVTAYDTPIAMFWQRGDEEWAHGNADMNPEEVARGGGEYHAPVATPEEVAALRGLNDALRLVIKQVEADVREFLQERDEAKDEASTLRARVETLEAALKWMIDNDETNSGDTPIPELKGQTWNEYNAYWLDGLNKARAALENKA